MNTCWRLCLCFASLASPSAASSSDKSALSSSSSPSSSTAIYEQNIVKYLTIRLWAGDFYQSEAQNNYHVIEIKSEQSNSLSTNLLDVQKFINKIIQIFFTDSENTSQSEEAAAILWTTTTYFLHQNR